MIVKVQKDAHYVKRNQVKGRAFANRHVLSSIFVHEVWIGVSRQKTKIRQVPKEI